VSDELRHTDDADRLALETRLLGVVRQLGPDERLVVLEVAERLVAGRKVYGPLDIAADPRDMRREAAEELLDSCVYAAVDALRQRGRGCAGGGV
jgi:hypothetical protein